MPVFDLASRSCEYQRSHRCLSLLPRRCRLPSLRACSAFPVADTSEAGTSCLCARNAIPDTGTAYDATRVPLLRPPVLTSLRLLSAHSCYAIACAVLTYRIAPRQVVLRSLSTDAPARFAPCYRPPCLLHDVRD
eukprot:671152-Rhodomonas_salina.4